MEQTVERKSFLFAVRIVKLSNHLNTNKKEYVISKQLLRAGTSCRAPQQEDSLDLGAVTSVKVF